VQCFWEEHQPQTIGLGALLLLLLFLLFRISRPAPYGALEQGGHVESLGRPFLTRIFGSSSISSKKLDGIFDFRGGEFVLDFKGGAHIKAKRDEPKITVRSGNNSSQVVSRSGVPLADNDTVSVGGYPVATFRDSDPNQESETYTHKDYY
jgi:hypothetical protein